MWLFLFLFWDKTILSPKYSTTLSVFYFHWYLTETIMDADYADDVALLANTPT